MPILMLIVVFFVLFLSHWLIYDFFVRSFSVKKKLAMKLIIASLGVSFIAFAVLVRLFENIFTKALYFISGIWIGILPALIILIALAWLIIVIAKLFKRKINIKYGGISVIVIIVIYIVVGVWNVYHPVVVKTQVEIKNLPENWQDKKMVQISDLHLGTILGEGFLKDVVEKINLQNPDLVVITGDLFDGMDGLSVDFMSQIDEIISKYGVYYISGNHETYIGKDHALSLLQNTKVNVIDDKIVNLDGLQLIGAGYTVLDEQKDIKQTILDNEDFNPELPTVLLYHTPTRIDLLEGSNHTTMYWSPESNFDAAKEIGIDLQLSGHTHRGQIFPFQFFTAIIYDGYDHGLHSEEDFSIYINSATGVWGPTLRTAGKSEITVLELRNKE